MQPYAVARTNLSEQPAPILIGPVAYQADLAQGKLKARGPDGETRYPMVAALGGKNVLYFLTPLERGRLQVLPLAYDLRRKEWFDVAGSAIRHFAGVADRPLDWRDPAYTFNSSCFNCHVSQLTNNYDPGTRTYHTVWAEPGINCETCHGPAADHIRVARLTPQGQPLADPRIIRTKTMTADQINSLCGSCHAKLYPLTSSFAPGEDFFDHFGLATLEQGDFYPDGRDLGENFTCTSWRLSPCLKSGKLSCISCHTSSGRFRFPGQQANQACMPCHEDKVRAVSIHSHHESRVGAPTCIACHMPKTEFARMSRSDHSLRPPMPAATLAFGSPNACNQCHTNRDAAWADRQVRAWHPDDYQAATLRRANWIAAARRLDWSRLPEMLDYLSSPGREEVWAASMLRLLRECDQEAKWGAIVSCLKDASPLVRAAAVEAAGDRVTETRMPLLLAATRDRSRLVRVSAAGVLAGVQLEDVPPSDRPALQTATDELVASFLARPDNSEGYANLGNFQLQRGELAGAVESFRTASQLQPRDISPRVNLSLVFNLLGQNPQAEASLRQAQRLEPDNAAVNLNLGMLLAEMKRPAEAEKALRAASQGSNSISAQAAFNLGVLLENQRPREALLWCKRAVQLGPDQPKYAYTLAYFQNQQGSTNQAVQTLVELLKQAPAHADSYGLLVQIYEQQGMTAEAKAVCHRAAANEKLSPRERARFTAREQSLSGK